MIKILCMTVGLVTLAAVAHAGGGNGASGKPDSGDTKASVGGTGGGGIGRKPSTGAPTFVADANELNGRGIAQRGHGTNG